MKKIILISLITLFTVHLSAQKQVRKNINAGNKDYKEQLYGTAEGKYQEAIKENPSSKEASYNLANTYYKQQRWDDALNEYQHYLTLEGEDPAKMSAAWSNVGNTYLKKKANEKAQQPTQPGEQQQADNLKMSMEAYKNALRLNPTDDATRYNLAVVQKMLKDQESENKDQDKQQDKDKDQKKEDKKDQNKQDQKQDKKEDQNQQNQMSQGNMEQILQAIEQDEKATQERVKQAKAQEQNKQNQNNKRQNKDW